jgi:hypothetical protein
VRHARRREREAAISDGTYTPPGREEWAASRIAEGWSPRLVEQAMGGGPLAAIRALMRDDAGGVASRRPTGRAPAHSTAGPRPSRRLPSSVASYLCPAVSPGGLRHFSTTARRAGVRKSGYRPARRLSSGDARRNFALTSGFVRCAYRRAIASDSWRSTWRTSSRSPVCRRIDVAA